MADAAIEQIKEYVFEDPEFEETFKTWANENAHHIDLSIPEEENKLEYTSLHQQFIELFNKKLDEKIEDQDVTTEAVFERLAHDAESDATSENAFLVRLLLSITDFRSFVQMMRETAQEAASESKQS